MASRLTHLIRSNIALCVALAVALTVGTAWAGTTAPKNSVVSKSIKDGEVKAADIGANAVDSTKIKDGTVKAAEIGANAVNSANVQDNSLTGADINEGTLSGLSPTGTAGGALAGAYPSPMLKVTGGPCPNGKALTNVSSGAALTCGPGVYSGKDPYDFDFNVAVAPNPFPAIAGGQGNSAIGDNTFNALTTGSYNSAVGSEALRDNTTAAFGTALGARTLSANTTGGSNTAVGAEALMDNTTGQRNTAVGDNALGDNIGGSNNIGLGYLAGSSLNGGDWNIDIGNVGENGDANTIRIGNPFHDRTFISGISGVAVVNPSSPVLVNADGQLGTTSSSRRFKRDIEPLDQASRKLMDLNPVAFRYRKSYVGGKSARQFGLLAEQVEKVYPNLVVYGNDGRPSAIAYQELPALLLAQAQRQQVQNEAQQARIAQLRRQVDRQRARNDLQDERAASLRTRVRWLMRHARSR